MAPAGASLVALLAVIDVEVEAGIEVVDELELRWDPRPPRRFDIRPLASRFDSTFVLI